MSTMTFVRAADLGVESWAPAAAVRPRKNSYAAAAPIATTLNMLWKTTKKAREDIEKLLAVPPQNKEGQKNFWAIVGEARTQAELARDACAVLHREATTLDSNLKKAARFNPVAANRQLRVLCTKILQQLDCEAFWPLVLTRIKHMVQPVRQVAEGRLARILEV